MFRILAFLSMMARIWSTVKFTMLADGAGFSAGAGGKKEKKTGNNGGGSR